MAELTVEDILFEDATDQVTSTEVGWLEGWSDWASDTWTEWTSFPGDWIDERIESVEDALEDATAEVDDAVDAALENAGDVGEQILWTAGIVVAAQVVLGAGLAYLAYKSLETGSLEKAAKSLVAVANPLSYLPSS